jgi:hypothetical protein
MSGASLGQMLEWLAGGQFGYEKFAQSCLSIALDMPVGGGFGAMGERPQDLDLARCRGSGVVLLH